MKWGIRTPSLRKRIAARTSWKRFVRHNLGFKAPRGWGWLTNPKKAAYNRVYNRTTISVDKLFSSGRSRRARSGSGGIGLFAVVLAVLAAAVFVAYAVIAAAVALVVWIIALASKKRASGGTARALVAADGPGDAPRPSNQYLEIIPVDPSVFDDPALAESTALKIFAAWAAQIPKAPRDATDLVRRLELRTRLVGRVTTQLEGRRVVWRSQAYGGRDRVGTPPALDPASIDPWQPSPELRGESRYVALCPTCNGEGKVICTSCGGTARRVCGACGGRGKYYGTAANGAQRLLNCKTCRGKGDVTCGDCSRGRVECGTCTNLKKLECWLEIDTSRREDVQVEPDGDVTKAFAWGQDGARASQDDIARDAKILASIELPRQFALEDLPATVPADWKASHWPRIQAQIQPSEHVASQRFTLLELPSIEVRYGLGDHVQSIAFEGRRMLAPSIETDDVLFDRARTLGRSKILLAMLPIAASTAYAARGAYFVTSRAAPFVAGVVLAAGVMALFGYVALWYATLRRRAGHRWALALLAPAAAAAALAVLAEPTRARTRASLHDGDLVAARAELNALGPYDDPDLACLWADLHLEEARRAKTCADAAISADLIDATAPQRHSAQAYVDDLARSEAEAAINAAHYADATRALKCGSDAAWDSPSGKGIRARIAIGEAQACEDSRNWSCAVDKARQGSALGRTSDADVIHAGVVHTLKHEADAAISAASAERDLEHRVSREHEALAAWGTYAVIAAIASKAEPPTLVALRQRTTRDEQALMRQQRAEQATREAEAKQREAAAARQRQREAAAQKHQVSEPQVLLCCDGSVSSCSCGGSHRGCCSRHGGVCGCR